MLKKSSLIQITLFLMGISPVFAQSLYDKTVTQLTNDNSKQWVYEKTDSFMPGKKCAKGEKWEFYKNGKVIIVKCIDKKEVKFERNWNLEANSAYDLILNVNGTSYTLMFPSKNSRSGNKERMILRIKATTTTDKTTDLEFYYNGD